MDLKSFFEAYTKTYFQKFLQKRATYTKIILKNERLLQDMKANKR